jgi:hypothetical protein
MDSGGVAWWRESEKCAEAEWVEVNGRNDERRACGGAGEVQRMGARAGGGQGDEMEAERKKSSGISSHGEETAADGVAASPGSTIGEIGGDSRQLRFF